MLTYLIRANIERAYGHEVDQLKKLYTQEDRELIKKFMEAKASFSPNSENFGLTSELEVKDIFGKHNLFLSLSVSLFLSFISRSLSLH